MQTAKISIMQKGKVLGTAIYRSFSPIAKSVGKVAGLAAATFAASAQTVTNSPTSITTGVAGGFDTGAVTGLSILGFLLILGAVVRGISVYRRR